MAAPAVSPSVTLANGRQMPIFGLGTWKSKPGEVYTAVKSAILDSGYRHIDCAWIYQNQDEVGKALTEVISSGAVKREELFITSKIWNTFHSFDKVAENLQETLKQLQLDYVDLLLIHWPFGYKEGEGPFPKNKDDSTATSDVDYLDTWRGLELAHSQGLAKSIGVSNFNSEQVARVLENAKVKPVVNQFESNPYLIQKELIEFCRQRDVAVTAYSPLGSPDRPWAKPGDPQLMDEPKLVEVAKRLNKSVAQVLIRYQIQRGVIVIPKSVTPSRIKSNAQVFDFELSSEDVAIIESFNRGDRACGMESVTGHKYFPFSIPY